MDIRKRVLCLFGKHEKSDLLQYHFIGDKLHSGKWCRVCFKFLSDRVVESKEEYAKVVNGEIEDAQTRMGIAYIPIQPDKKHSTRLESIGE